MESRLPEFRLDFNQITKQHRVVVGKKILTIVSREVDTIEEAEAIMARLNKRYHDPANSIHYRLDSGPAPKPEPKMSISLTWLVKLLQRLFR